MKKSVFESTVEKAFISLEARYGFKKMETRYADRSVSVVYQNPTTQILLNYEIGNTPWLEFSDIKQPENKSTLGWLLVEQGVEEAPTPQQAFQPSPLKDVDLAPVLQKMTAQLMKYGEGVLKGDFSLMPHLQLLAKNYDLECQHFLSVHKSKT